LDDGRSCRDGFGRIRAVKRFEDVNIVSRM
jgi:hypothetical protein